MHDPYDSERSKFNDVSELIPIYLHRARARTDGRMDGRSEDEQTNGRTDGRTDEKTKILNFCENLGFLRKSRNFAKISDFFENLGFL